MTALWALATALVFAALAVALCRRITRADEQAGITREKQDAAQAADLAAWAERRRR